MEFSREYIDICKKLPDRNLDDWNVGDWAIDDHTDIVHVIYESDFNMELLILNQGKTVDDAKFIDRDDLVWVPHTVQQWMKIKDWPLDWIVSRKEGYVEWLIFKKLYDDTELVGGLRVISFDDDPLMACAKAWLLAVEELEKIGCE